MFGSPLAHPLGSGTVTADFERFDVAPGGHQPRPRSAGPAPARPGLLRWDLTDAVDGTFYKATRYLNLLGGSSATSTFWAQIGLLAG